MNTAASASTSGSSLPASSSNSSPSSPSSSAIVSSPPPSSPSPSSSLSPPASSLPSSASISPINPSLTTSSAPTLPSSTFQPSSTVLTTPSRTVSQSTLIATSNGQTFTSIVQVTSTIAVGPTVVANSSSGTHHNTPNTAAIVGGVIGGLALLGIAAGAFVWYRRRFFDDTDFDGNFDPARVARPGSSGPQMIATGGTLPRMNIEDEDVGMAGRLGGAIITPFAYTPAAIGSASSRSQSPPVPSASPPPMSQHSTDGSTPTMSSSGGYYAAVPQQVPAVGTYYPSPPRPPSSSESSVFYDSPRSAKEREAAAATASGSRRSGAFAVTNPDSSRSAGGHEELYQAYLRSGPSPQNARGGVSPGSQSEYSDMMPRSSTAPSPDGGVIVHQDGGRVEPEIAHQDEIPPTYDSIPSGQPK
ncbi:hypothetical protein GGX14DRAFT_419848 [Mycena pura]|uniref:Uncharacterized protein n=1 Tax=Mycena pura TaxID=153505 RepID=A0AAD6YP10_9AGAR|nr:hypothetical protein GGX14DRAFT_419848 [Mycena pura]